MDKNKVALTTAERIESFKIGTLAAIAFTLSYSLTILSLSRMFGIFSPLGWLSVAIAFLSGFLFGVTYRYIVQNQENPHLKDGAVLAFGLVRGLVPLETTTSEGFNEHLPLIGLFLAQSLLCFAITRSVLDLAFGNGWLKP